MNIKQHIEAGHYPVDDKGRALVPVKNGGVATIAATDGPPDEKLIGWYAIEGDGAWVCSWNADGSFMSSPYHCDLLPPPARKVKVTGWAIVGSNDRKTHSIYRTEQAARSVSLAADEIIVPLVGEYAESWDA
jgi:hypothetical protein